MNRTSMFLCIPFDVYQINVRENRRGPSTMDNPEKLAKLGTDDTRRRQTKQNTQPNICWTTLYGKKTQIMYIRHDPTNNGGKDEPNIKGFFMYTLVYIFLCLYLLIRC
jgi:hypothetical protein